MRAANHRRPQRVALALFALALLVVMPLVALGHDHDHEESEVPEHCVVCAHLSDVSAETVDAAPSVGLNLAEKTATAQPSAVFDDRSSVALSRGPPKLP